MVACGTGKQQPTENEFVYVKDGQFIRHGKPYYYVGTNFWYGAILGSEGTGGNRTRLCQELDSLKALGIDNLRILVGADGQRGVPTKVEPTLQTAPGVYNDTILAGLDYLLAEMNKRDMLAILYLNNSWEWSGGYGMYLEWSGHGKAPVPAVDGWPQYMEYVKQYAKSDSAQAIFKNYVKDIITRTNRYTGKKYTEDPTIMSWQIGNEPRAFADENKEAFANWMADVAALIDSLAPNQLISSGSEGKHGCEQDIALFEKIHSNPHIDYLNIHIWPYNWGWANKDSLVANLDRAKENTGKYIAEHMAVAERCKKPVVIEEFGYPRDGFQFGLETPVTSRNGYYEYIFKEVQKNAAQKGLLAGCNFWGWGGMAIPSKEHTFWQVGDDYCGDPAQEEQGLNSVFISDKETTALVKSANDALQAAVEEKK
ncbi:beta-galactosidase [uncultured Bacteroides sp.]|uniref:glycoside hydrolase 5 family protein n=1 Tax=uncultured Bacteroides sp. TaxID=162156 RepID=UPI00261FB1F3|nr:beta-galactosidase [uncultured Bacteroides sp.]